ncbi:hypothetical protein TSTA_033130 [Talaromyces stipitatus ATCC 10500]|uniref:Uncharacterized protein n=1 Tax=Talaromyces stipitatus (strain ATCC 10500 / CBS 375.48 / QM 6759 / NRRL 1006) TaxID=441959 RepID=B8M5T9_TALSN|nr:uncharacterized protein TSTA_033130 [Talaromyces stipitatus ATCC 10500]EED20066.1 hypothetical protein TSTA_033130 [Talaromyces stipitatus ATCC 10500]
MASFYRLISLVILLTGAIALPLDVARSAEPFELSDEASWKAEILETGAEPTPQSDLR